MTRTPGPAWRVLLVTHYYPPHQGGIENVAWQEARHLVRRGVEVTVLTTGSRTATGVSDDDVRVAHVAATNVIERRFGVPFPVASVTLLPAALRWARWADVIHIHDCLYMTSWAAGLAALATGTPYVMTQHVALVEHPGAVVRRVQRAVYQIAGRRLLSHAARVLVLNTTVAAFAVEQGASLEAVRHLANGVDPDLFRPARSDLERAGTRARFGLPQGRVLVLFAGRLVPKKGFDLLMAAADDAYDLVFASAGTDGRPNHDRPGFHYLGTLSPADLAEVYRACDIFALPSTAEGFPLTVQEAMSSGLPVVTTDDPGYAPYGLDRNHIALLPREVGALRETLRSLSADPERRARMGRWSRQHATARFVWTDHTAQLMGIYNEVLAVPDHSPH